jgi:radical SAM superfamily enzyme YgiQ (UPF0313 family)
VVESGLEAAMSWRMKERLEAVAAREQGSVVKDWGGRASVALVYPNSYRVGMGNLAVHSIYAMLNGRRAVACERAFLPGRADLEEHRRSGTPVLAIESRRPLSEFDFIALSCSFENDYLGIIPILELCRIPHRKDARGPSGPVIIAGGAAPTLNPRPMAAIADAVLPGEFEAYCEEIAAVMEASLPKPEAVAALGRISGVLTGPSRGSILRRHAQDLDPIKTQTAIYAKGVEFGEMHLIEAERGCPRGCRFCATPAIYGKPRRRGAAAILEMVEDGLPHRGRMGLIGADILSHPGFEEIARGIHGRGATFSPSSVRVDAVDAAKAALLAKSGHKSVALGIEGGSEGLRRTLGKAISDERILAAAATLAGAGITRVRLYFMIGLPGETERDIAGIADIACRVRDEVRRHAGRGARSTAVDLTVTPFVPKPSTPFEGKPFAGEDYLKRRVKDLRRLVGAKDGISMQADSAVDAAIEHLIANADEDCVEFLEEAHRVGARDALKA